MYTNITCRTALGLLTLAFLSLQPVTGVAGQPVDETPQNIATFSVVAYDPATGEVGVAVQSKFFAVGSVVPYAEAGVGAIASQAFGNTTFGPRGLAMMREGMPAAQALLAMLRDDEDAARRQVGIVAVSGGDDPSGMVALIDPELPRDELPEMGFAEEDGAAAFTYTGGECMDWAGGFASVTSDGVIFCCQGNILTGADVVDAMAYGMEHGIVPDGTVLTKNELQAISVHDLAGRMMAALLSGQSKGGDSRGMQSSALLIKQTDAGYGGYNDVKYDLRVDDALDPFDELARLLNLARPFAMTNEAYRILYAGEYERAAKLFGSLIALEPEKAGHHYNLACALSLGGSLDAALEELTSALELDPTMSQHASQDSDLDALHEMEGFAELFEEELEGSV